jgi:hypothetical protein
MQTETEHAFMTPPHPQCPSPAALLLENMMQTTTKNSSTADAE